MTNEEEGYCRELQRQQEKSEPIYNIGRRLYYNKAVHPTENCKCALPYLFSYLLKIFPVICQKKITVNKRWEIISQQEEIYQSSQLAAPYP